MKITLSNQALDALDMSDVLGKAAVDVERKLIVSKSGKDHYRLLKYLSQHYENSLFCDLGTHKGSSAFSLGSNLSNKVVSFDIEERIIPIIETIKYQRENPIIVRPANIDFIVASRILDYQEVLLRSEVIFIDISHNGKDEKEIYNFLLSHNWRGIMILDDVKYYTEWERACGKKNEDLKELYDWFNELNSRSKSVYDLTCYGHHTGTGLISFNDSLEIICA